MPADQHMGAAWMVRKRARDARTSLASSSVMPLSCSSSAAFSADKSSKTDPFSSAGDSSSATGASHIHTLDIARREGCCSIKVGAKPVHKEQIIHVSQLISAGGSVRSVSSRQTVKDAAHY